MPDKMIVIGKHRPGFETPTEFFGNSEQATMQHAQALREQWVKPWELHPLYLRQSDAEINWPNRESA